MTFTGDVVDLVVERVVPGGEGLARLGGVVTLVSGALPGDSIQALVDEAGPRLVRARTLSVQGPGPHRRVEGDVCPRAVDGTCGGCDWPAARPASHEELKRALVLDALRRIGGIAPASLPTLRWYGSPAGYRLRSRLHVDGAGRVGFFAPRSTTVSPLTACELLSPQLLARLPAIAAAFASAAAAGEEVAGDLRTLETPDGGTLLGELSASHKVRDAAALAERLLGPLDGIRVVGPGLRSASRGPASLLMRVGAASFRVSVSSFFQGNRFLLEAFLDEVRRLVAAGIAGAPGGAVGSLLDLYAGCGFLSRPLAETGLPATAVESDPSSAADLEANVASWRREGLTSLRGVRATVEGFVARDSSLPGLVVADPPRAGLGPSIRRAILARAPAALVLVSCDPATLARDLKELVTAYDVEDGALLDLFPGTHHLETLLLLRRRRRE